MKINYPATLRDARISRQQMAEIDEREGRERVPAAVLDSAIGLMAALRLLEDDNRLIEPTARKFGCWNALRSAEGMLGKALIQFFSRLRIRQSDTVLANCHNAKVAVSVRPMPLRLNLLASDVDTLVNYALHYCNHECLNTEQEARRCPLRDVYGVIPGMEGSADAMGMCPYMGHERMTER